MIVKAIKTRRVVAGLGNIFDLLDESLPKLKEKSIVAITSKVVSICEGQVAAMDKFSKDELIEQEADFYLPAGFGRHDYSFAIKNGALISAAGIDESNGDNNYVLWPKNPQATANQIRKHLVKSFDLKNVGVIITDSTCIPLRRGTIGLIVAHSGFNAVEDYRQKPDLFGREFKVSRAGLASGLAAAAVLTMGEGTEQTPIALITDVAFVKFQPRNPTKAELAELHVPRDEDLFAPFLNSVNWQSGKKSK